MGNLLTAKDNIQTKIHSIRGIDVMLDSDIAELYGVETREVNQAVARNPDKFPSDFMFELTAGEFANLKSQFVTSSWGGRRNPPKAFTEQGVYLLATVLKGAKATEITIAIMRTFTKMRRYLVEHGDLHRQISELKEEMVKNKEWTKERLLATTEAITILEEMILEIKAAKEVESIGFLRSEP
jgi:phage regulator Rha-like protein